MRASRTRAVVMTPVAVVLAISTQAAASHDICHQRGVLDPVGDLITVVEAMVPLDACTPENRPPDVTAGTLLRTDVDDAARLRGSVVDDGLPDPPGKLTIEWTQSSGPGIPTFADRRALATSVTFPKPGRYVLKLSADDGDLRAADEIVIEVRALPTHVQPPRRTDELADRGTTDVIVPVAEGRAGADRRASIPDPTPGVPTLGPVTPTSARSPLESGLTLAGILTAVLAAAWLGSRRGGARATKRTNDQFDMVLDLLPDAIVTTDPTGRVRAVNTAAVALLAASPDEVRGRPLASILSGTTESGAWLPTWVRAQIGRSAVVTATLERDAIPVALSIAPAGNGGMSVCVMRDLRPERAVERMKRQFLANVGHELRTPLTSALGFARILRDRRVSPEQEQSFVNAVVGACEKLDRVIDLLIDVATIEGGAVQSPTEEIDVAAIADGVVGRWSDMSSKHVFSTMIASGGAHVRGNEALLRHALHELVDNAIKFSPDGGLITVGVRADRPAREVTIIVSDQGIGVSGAAAETMFDDFTQGDGSETRVYGGLGLGLAFVRRVTTLHGGRIEVVSQPEQGTSVSLKLPMSVRSATRPARARDASRA